MIRSDVVSIHVKSLIALVGFICLLFAPVSSGAANANQLDSETIWKDLNRAFIICSARPPDREMIRPPIVPPVPPK